MRVKTGVVRRRKHKKILKTTKGYRMTRNRLYKVAHEAYMHAGQYSYAHRRRRHSQMKRIWIDRISAAAKNAGLNYSRLMKKLKDAKIELNRKVLADMALNNPESFMRLVQSL